MRAVEQTGGLHVHSSVVELFRGDKDWRMFFAKCCKESPERLRSGAKQVRDELADRGQRFDLEEVEDVLLTLAREKLPDSPGARWDADHASQLCKDSLARLGKFYARLPDGERAQLNLGGQEPHETAMLKAGQENDPAAFRAALKGWEVVGLEAFEKASSKKGAVA